MRNPWGALRCFLDFHRWQAIEVSGDRGWKCSDCRALVLEREYLERVHDPEATSGPAMPGGAAAGVAPPFM